MKKLNKNYYFATIIILVFAILFCIGFINKATIAGEAYSPQTLQNDKAIEYLKQTGGYKSLVEAMTAERYKIQTDSGDLTALNSDNNLRATFTADGLRLLDIKKEQNEQKPEVNWQLTSVGRGEYQTDIPAGNITSAGNRVEVRRDLFGLTEYFENTPDGLEQGFILNERPITDDAGESLSLILQTDGDYLATADADGQGLTLNAKNGGESLRYEKLKAWDADGTELIAKMTASGSEIRLEVEDAAAKYPVTIDPTFVRTAKLRASDGAVGDFFGSSVAVSGDTAIIGADNDDIGANADQGSAYVFIRSGANWTQQTKLIANDGAAGDRFGDSVAVSGDTVIVGAGLDDIGANGNQGSAYVFVRNGANWSQQTKLISNDGAAGDRFGDNVAISGETIVVGAAENDIGANTDQGSAYIFIRSGVNWSLQSKLTANDGAASDKFGYDVAISGETVIVGAIWDDIGANNNQGSAYIFVRNAVSWSQQAKLLANDGAAGDLFGLNVAISGETVIVGAPYDDTRQGSAYVFVRNGVNWSQQTKLIATDGSVNQDFGNSVAISGETVVVGSNNQNVGGNDAQGSAYIFVRNGTNWTQQAKLSANDGAALDQFGFSVAMSGETVIVGSPYDDIGIGINDNQGSAYIYRSVGGVWQSEKQIASDGAANDHFGDSVAVSNDTAVVGAPLDDNGAFTESGAAYVFVKTGSVWTQQTKLLSPDPGTNEKFGASVAISEDIIIVGAPEDNIGGNIDQGAAYIFVRSGAIWIPQPKLTASDGERFDNFGISVSISGFRAIVGAHLNNVVANADQGAAYIFSLSSGTWTQQAKLTAADGAANDYFGYSVGISFDTAIVGAYGSDTTGNIDRGASYIFRNTTGSTWTQQTKLQNSSAGDNQGYSVAISGDTVAVGSPKRIDSGRSDVGRVYVYIRGTGTSWTSQSSFTPSDGTAGDQFGYNVAIDGELIAAGSPFSDPGGISNKGSAYVYIRSGTAWSQLTKLLASDGAASDQNGFGVAISGATVVSGANLDDVGANADQGSAYFFQALSSGKNSPFDFDGDGKTDIGIFRPAPAEWWINRSSTGVTFATQFGQTSDKIVPSDFTGDGKADIAFFRASIGFWFILRSEDFSFYSFPFGANGDLPAPADYDGDGKTDAAVFRPSALTWYISKSSGGTDIVGFGAANDKPVIGDYDGDGKADIAIFRNGPNGAEWWIRRSSNATVFATQFGLSTDNPTPGDFTGDGKTDIAFFRPSNGTWFVLRSEDFSFYSFPFGASGDIPVPGDYDGDGKFDSAVFRPSNTTWYIQRSTAGTSIQQFGANGDRPLPNAFVP